MKEREMLAPLAESMQVHIPTVTPLLQSPYIHLQAAGSKGLDSSEGIHLRWMLNGYLGENHLPKADYAGNEEFFNKKNDYVHLYRIPYDRSKRVVTTFHFDRAPSYVHDGLRLWVYVNNNDRFYLYFRDSLQYYQVSQTVKAKDDFSRFLHLYGNRILELELRNELSFSVGFSGKENSKLRAETLSVQNVSVAEQRVVVSARKTLVVKDTALPVIVSENIRSVRFCTDSGSLSVITFETYSDFLQHSMKNKRLEPIDKFALTTEDAVAYTRLEDAPRFEIDNKWRKFNDGALVNAKNYRNRWSMPDGLKEGVLNYISKSDTDPTATVSYQEELTNGDESEMEVSLQQFLNVAASDFHIARMLGLGYVDTPKMAADDQYIYMVIYHTEKHPANYTITRPTLHYYLSLPTGYADQRLPEKLKLRPVTYGLTVDNGTGTPMLITDEEGYAPYTAVRYINLRAVLKNDYGSESNQFFIPSIEFASSEFTMPLFVGFENRKEGEADWIKPEMSHEIDFEDTDGSRESKPSFFTRNNKPQYIHGVVEEGVDEYVAYPVNIFARANDISNKEQTDKTIFKKINTLKAPLNVTAQLIQAEDPLLLTAAAEQAWLKAIDTSKKEILCRVTFDYYHLHDLNYHYGNSVRIFHRKQLPLNVIGAISSVDNNDPQNPFCTVNTTNYTYSNGDTFKPSIDPAKKDHFIGSMLTVQNKNYLITEIILPDPSGDYPRLKIRKTENRIATPVGSGFQLTQVYEAPVAADEGFLVVENLSKAENWAESTPDLFGFEIKLGLPSWPEHTETYLDSEGNSKEEIVKGIWDTTDIQPLEIGGVLQEGYYEINFRNHVLNDHPQFTDPANAQGKHSVNWYRGFVRVHRAGDAANAFQRKLLKVEQVLGLNTGGFLKLVAFDQDYSTTDPGKNIKTGNSIQVNYHPGYRVYLRKEDSIHFNQANLLPTLDEGTRTGLLGLQTVDSTTPDANGDAYVSPMSVPALLAARELRAPKQPRVPIGGSFANPPDYYNKANYSFTTGFDETPWGLLFFRIDKAKILSCLYKQSTIDTILANLPAVKDDLYLGNRWLDLLSFDYASNGGNFEAFPVNTSGDTYRFPNPDRTDVFPAAYSKPGDVADLMKRVVHANLLPLTEQPLIFKYIKGGNYIPRPGKQKLRDKDGKILHPSHPEFDQAPMAKKISPTKVLFTDFTFDGNMSSENFSFYLVRELSNSMQMGEASGFLGPVKPLNTKAPGRLELQKLQVQIGSAVNGYASEVIFELNQLPASQEVSRIQVRRSFTAADAHSVRTMEVVNEVSALAAGTGTLVVRDNFSGTPEIPYSIPIYYRLVGVREIGYTDAGGTPQNIEVFSEPTKTFVANLVDSKRPDSPVLTVSNQVNSANQIEEISFTWNKTCYNGKYRLYIMRNNDWQKIHEIRTNDMTAMHFTFDTSLDILNDSGDRLYHKFKVDAENTAGLSNLESVVLAVSG